MTRFDTLEHLVGETYVILYVHPLIFLRCFLSLLKFSLIFMNTQMKFFHIEPLDERSYQIVSLIILKLATIVV